MNNILLTPAGLELLLIGCVKTLLFENKRMKNDL